MLLVAFVIAALLLIGLAVFRFLAPEPNPTILRISCEGGTTTVLTPVVGLRTDGLHVIVEGDVSRTAAVLLGNPDVSAAHNTVWNSGSEGISDEFVRPVPPGEGHVLCVSLGAGIISSTPEAVASWSSFRIEPAGAEPSRPGA